MKKGFSLAEVMIVLSVIGIIMTLTIPTMVSSFSTSNKLAYRSAYKLIEQVVSDMVMDTVTFPGGILTNDLATKSLCNKFIDRVNIVGNVPANCTTSAYPDTPSFITSNGMRWYKFEQNFANTPANLTIFVDVDGKGRGKNALGSDIFRVVITSTAKVQAPSNSTETSYLID